MGEKAKKIDPETMQAKALTSNADDIITGRVVRRGGRWAYANPGCERLEPFIQQSCDAAVDFLYRLGMMERPTQEAASTPA